KLRRNGRMIAECGTIILVGGIMMSDPHQITCEPCAICGDVGGRWKRKNVPGRTSLKRFGLEGRGCVRCYNRLNRRVNKGLPIADAVAGLLPRKTSTPPCV